MKLACLKQTLYFQSTKFIFTQQICKGTPTTLILLETQQSTLHIELKAQKHKSLHNHLMLRVFKNE